MRGFIKYERREFDDTLVPKGDQVLREGELFYVLRATQVKRQSWFTKFMLAVTGGLWPFGRHVYVPAIREDRMRKRDQAY